MTEEITVSVPRVLLEQLLDDDRDSIRVPESIEAPNTTPIGSVMIDDTVDIMGVVRKVSDINTFDRSDDSEGKVRNIRIQDKTGDIRCALWGEHTDVQFNVGDYVHVLNAEIQDGYQDTREASVGWDSSIYVVSEPHDEPTHVTIAVEDDT